MAIEYEHGCRDCGLYWIETYSLEDLPPEQCPQCEGYDVFRCVGSAGFQLKGSGWERDGYYKWGPTESLHKTGAKVTMFDSQEEADASVAADRQKALGDRGKLKG